MVQMLGKSRPAKAKKLRLTPKLQNTTIRDFGGGLNVVDSEQNLTSKFAPVFDNMVTYTDRRVGPRNGYEMWLKLKQGVEGMYVSATISIATADQSKIVGINHVGHPFTGAGYEHVAIFDWATTYNGVTPEMLNRTHGIRRVINADAYEIVVSNTAVGTGTSPVAPVTIVRDTHALGGEPVECKYFSNYVIVWDSTGGIIGVDRDKGIRPLWNSAIAYGLPSSIE